VIIFDQALKRFNKLVQQTGILAGPGDASTAVQPPTVQRNMKAAAGVARA
jgi:ribosomal protein S21